MQARGSRGVNRCRLLKSVASPTSEIDTCTQQALPGAPEDPLRLLPARFLGSSSRRHTHVDRLRPCASRAGARQRETGRGGQGAGRRRTARGKRTAPAAARRACQSHCSKTRSRSKPHPSQCWQDLLRATQSATARRWRRRSSDRDRARLRATRARTRQREAGRGRQGTGACRTARGAWTAPATARRACGRIAG